MKITFDNITLRDYVLTDVEDEIRWTNKETEWFYSEAPWMKLEPVDVDELRADMAEIINDMVIIEDGKLEFTEKCYEIEEYSDRC